MRSLLFLALSLVLAGSCNKSSSERSEVRTLASFAPPFDRGTARALLDGTWKVRYRFAEHKWTFANGGIVVDGSQPVSFGAVDNELSDVVRATAMDGSISEILVLYAGDGFFAASVPGPYGVARNGRYVVTIGSAVLELKGDVCTQYGSTQEGFITKGSPATCSLAKDSDTTRFVYKEVGPDMASGSLIVTGNAIVNEGLMGDRATRLD